VANHKDDFRDHIATVDDEGHRIWLNPKKPSGKFYNARILFGYLLLLIMFGVPFIKLNGHPFMLFDILNRHFIIFGIPFWPQDSEIFAVGVLIFLVFIILFTAIFGRLWCGWACPQTVFMEIVFRRIEYWIEGDSSKQRKLHKMPWNREKIVKKGSKHLIFFAISFLISNIFLSYFIGMDELLKIISEPPSMHITGLSIMILFSLVFYWIYASFREQVCTLVCPYGRLQSVMLDKNSIVVSYDFVRGEPRTKAKNADENSGDCVDCGLCVSVCPTGIDIRNGQQLECINCTACMDACDNVMTSIKKPTGLIRYASYTHIKEGIDKLVNGRSIGYTAFLLLLIVVFNLFMGYRTETETTILRASGSLPQQLENGYVRNLFTVKTINKSFEEKNIKIELISPAGSNQLVAGRIIHIESSDLGQTAMFVDILPENLTGKRTQITLQITDIDNNVLETVKTNFLAPGDMKFE